MRGLYDWDQLFNCFQDLMGLWMICRMGPDLGDAGWILLFLRYVSFCKIGFDKIIVLMGNNYKFIVQNLGIFYKLLGISHRWSSLIMQADLIRIRALIRFLDHNVLLEYSLTPSLTELAWIWLNDFLLRFHHTVHIHRALENRLCHFFFLLLIYFILTFENWILLFDFFN